MSTAARGLKRRMESVSEDVEMQAVDDELNPSPSEAVAPPPAKKRAVDNLNAVERSAPPAAPTSNKPPSKVLTTDQGKQGAVAGKPDTDAAFLKAIASTKRGKKTEDAFDREFNNLKISKPGLVDNPDPEEEWAVLAEFGDDSGLRGNFMTVVEMELYRKDDDAALQRTINHFWDGKPNFKKFKKARMIFCLSSRKLTDSLVYFRNSMGWRGQKLISLLVTKMTMAWALVCLTLNPFHALDLIWAPSAYWNGKNTQRTQTQIPLVDSQNDESQFNSQPPPRTKSKSRPPPDSNDEELPVPVLKTRKPPSRARSAAPSKKATTTTKNKTSAKAAALFIQSDDDVEELHEFTPPPSQVVDQTFDAEETLQSSAEVKPQAPPGRRSTRTAKAKTSANAKKTLVVEDDSDDDAVFQGFRAKKGGR